PRQTRSASWGPAQRVPTPSWALPRGQPKVLKWQVLLLQRARGPGASPCRSPRLRSWQSVPPLCDTALGAHRPQLTDGGSEALPEARCCRATLPGLGPRRVDRTAFHRDHHFGKTHLLGSITPSSGLHSWL
uniref:Uncharacterized protein n=1 Tax=Mustela putorius furo TaxID=9669 RepID=M3YBZ5_MUSPF